MFIIYRYSDFLDILFVLQRNTLNGQKFIYNIELKAPFIAVTNGSMTSCFMIDKENHGFTFLTGFPVYPTM